MDKIENEQEQLIMLQGLMDRGKDITKTVDLGFIFKRKYSRYDAKTFVEMHRTYETYKSEEDLKIGELQSQTIYQRSRAKLQMVQCSDGTWIDLSEYACDMATLDLFDQPKSVRQYYTAGLDIAVLSSKNKEGLMQYPQFQQLRRDNNVSE